MRRASPVDKERNESTFKQRPWTRQAPSEYDTVSANPASGKDFAKENATSRGALRHVLETVVANSPGHEARLAQVIDTKRSRAWRLGLPRVRGDDFEVGVGPEGDEAIVRTPCEVLTANGGTDARECFDFRNTASHVRSGVDDVIDPGLSHREVLTSATLR
jgi:hypothetical protein